MMWRNDKTIVFGKHQNPYKEIHMNKVENENVALARRSSGGGCVYQDLNNTCFSFFIPIYDATRPFDTKEENNKIILDALSAFGLQGEVSGRNDLLLEGKKFSGSAYEVDLGGKHTQKKALHHGTLLIDVDFKALQNYLNPHKKKLISKGVDSVASRVTNLKEYSAEINHDSISKAMFESFRKHYHWCSEEFVTIDDPLEYNPKAKEVYEKLTDKDWVFGQSPSFSNNLEEKFPWGLIDLHLEVARGGKIEKAKVFSDCLVPDFIDKLEEELNKKSYAYSKESFDKLGKCLKSQFEDKDNVQAMIDDLVAWLKTEM